MIAPRRGCLDYSKVYCDGSLYGIKIDILRITYFKLNILIPKSVMVFFTFTPLRLMTPT